MPAPSCPIAACTLPFLPDSPLGSRESDLIEEGILSYCNKASRYSLWITHHMLK